MGDDSLGLDVAQRAALEPEVGLVLLGEEIGLRTRERVVRLLRLLQREPLPWVRNLQPAYCSLLVSFDACAVDHAHVEATLRSYEQRAQKIALPTPRANSDARWR